MTSDPKNLPIDELEVSVRTATFLEGLPVGTVGELLDLPVISGPRPSLHELEHAFQELGVTYAGDWESLEQHAAEATGTVAERWETIRSWLQEKHPDRLKGFLPEAHEEQIARVEAALGGPLPDEYRAFTRIHDGQKPDEPMVWTCALRPIEELPQLQQSLLELYDHPGQPVSGDIDATIKAVNVSAGWIPIGVSARGRDFMCLDLDPTPQGQRGQIILVAVDADDHELLASGFGELLSLYFREAQAGQLELEA